MERTNIEKDNYKIFAALSDYLVHNSDFISKEEIEEIVKCGVSTQYAFALLLSTSFGCDMVEDQADKDLFNQYFIPMVHELDQAAYIDNLYYKNIKIPRIKNGSIELRYEKYKPFEGFVCDDIIEMQDGRQIPQIGFFSTEFCFPAILENNRIWMTITPNEIATMKEAVDEAFGDVLTFGLGLGYYTYMVAEKDHVANITVVESNDDVITLFRRYILPQFKNAHKIKLIKADAFEYAKKYMMKEKYDFVFTDLWHDVSDGTDMYLKMKMYEKQNLDAVFMYWIEKSIHCYL